MRILAAAIWYSNTNTRTRTHARTHRRKKNKIKFNNEELPPLSRCYDSILYTECLSIAELSNNSDYNHVAKCMCFSGRIQINAKYLYIPCCMMINAIYIFCLLLLLRLLIFPFLCNNIHKSTIMIEHTKPFVSMIDQTLGDFCCCCFQIRFFFFQIVLLCCNRTHTFHSLFCIVNSKILAICSIRFTYCKHHSHL